MSCTDDAVVEREIELDAPIDDVWNELPALFEDDGNRDAVVEDVEFGRRLTFWWTTHEGDDPASYVEIELTPSGVGTLIRVRETRLDGAHLERAVSHARAHA